MLTVEVFFVSLLLTRVATERSNTLSSVISDAGEIERMVKEAQEYKAEDEKERDRILSLNILESYSFKMKSAMESIVEYLENVIRKCKETVE